MRCGIPSQPGQWSQASEGNLFEEYTYFAISTSRLQIAYLSNSAVSSNIPYLVIHILRQNSGNALYEMEPDTLIDTDIKKKLKSLGTKIKVQGTVVNQEQHIIGGMQSLRQLENTLSTKFSAKVKLTARVTKQLTDDDIDAITNLATLDDPG